MQSTSLCAWMHCIQTGKLPAGLRGCWELLGRKHLFVALVVLRQALTLLSTWALVSKHLELLVVLPLLEEGVRFTTDTILQKESVALKKRFRRMVIDHFCALPYTRRKRTVMEPFSETITSASYVLETSLTWGIPTIIDGAFSVVSTVWAIIAFGYWFLLPIIAFIYATFKVLYLNTKTTVLKDIRTKRKEEDKKVDGIKNFRWHELQTLNANSTTIEEMTAVIDELEMQFSLGWETISTSIVFVSLCVSATGLYPIKEAAKFFAAKVVFNNLTGCTTMLAHFGNYWSSRAKDFDKFQDWFNENAEVEPDAPQFVLSTDGLVVSGLKIRLGELVISADTQMQLKPGSAIMLRGPSGSGKTQTLNALQGLIPGATFNYCDPRNYTQQFEYCNQQTREYLPTSGVSLLQMLSNEWDLFLIEKLIFVAQLKQKFPDKESYDVPLENLSGGEKMRLAIVYTLWRAVRQCKSIVVLDEPEQGLDEECRTILLQNVAQWARQHQKVLLVVFHGSAQDIWALRTCFHKVWLFKTPGQTTTVEECDFASYAMSQRNEAIAKLQ